MSSPGCARHTELVVVLVMQRSELLGQETRHAQLAGREGAAFA